MVIIVVIKLYALNYIVRNNNRKHFTDAIINLQSNKTVKSSLAFPMQNFHKPHEQYNTYYISNTNYIVNTYYIADTYYAQITY